MRKKENSKSVKRTFLIALTCFLAIILIVLLVGTILMESVLNLIGRDDNKDDMLSAEDFEQILEDQKTEKDPNFQGTVIEKDDVQLNTETGPVEDSQNIINIMLVGQDRRPGEGRQRSDVMMLCTFNKVTKQLTTSSFMRDMYVDIPGYSATKMNAAYQLGGMELLEECMAVNFGVHVDGSVEVDFNGFIGVIDLLGGIEMELTESEAEYLNYEFGLESSTVWNLQPGVNQLNGEQALSYARTRYVGNGDFDRTERQRKVIGKLIEKCKAMNLTQMKDLMEEVLPMITTNLSNKEILEYMLDMLPVLTNLQVNTQQIPAEGTWEYAEIDELSVLLVDLEANREILKQIMAEE